MNIEFGFSLRSVEKEKERKGKKRKEKKRKEKKDGTRGNTSWWDYFDTKRKETLELCCLSLRKKAERNGNARSKKGAKGEKKMRKENEISKS